MSPPRATCLARPPLSTSSSSFNSIFIRVKVFVLLSAIPTFLFFFHQCAVFRQRRIRQLLAIAFCRFLSLLLFCCCGNSSRQGRRERPRRFFFCQCTSSRWAPTSRCRHKPATTWPWATPKTNKKLRATWHFSDSLLESGKKTRAKLKTPVTLDGLFPSIGGQLAMQSAGP